MVLGQSDYDMNPSLCRMNNTLAVVKRFNPPSGGVCMVAPAKDDLSSNVNWKIKTNDEQVASRPLVNPLSACVFCPFLCSE
jgi:hypothetical protein